MGGFLERNDQACAIGVLTVWTAIAVASYWNTWSLDMSAVYMAGWFIWNGEPSGVYLAPPDFFSKQYPARWTEVLASIGRGDESAVPFIYPPIWAVLVAPLAGLTTPETFFNITRIPMFTAFAGTIFLAWRFMRPEGISATLFAVISIIVASMTIPFLFSASLNQPQFLVIFLIMLAFERYGAGHHSSAGLALGVAAAIKVSPILLALIFLADRNWRTALISGVTAAGIAFLSLLVAGPELHFALIESVRHVQELVPLIGFNMNFETFMYDFLVSLPDHPNSPNKLLGVNHPAVALANSALLPLSMLALLFVTRHLEDPARLKVRLFLIYTTTIWFGPIAWMHYYTLPLILMPGLVGLWSLRTVAIATALMVVGFSKPLMMGLVDFSLDRGAYTVFYPQHTALVPLAGIVIALILWSLRQGRTPRTSGGQTISA